jgi:catechol 2,3-dioxygenase-like lactoylglutathione lyase family enzyme
MTTMMTTGRVHISLPVSDLAASIDFYRRLFGTAPSKERSDYANFRLDSPAIHLSLCPSASAAASSAHQHFGVELPDAASLAAWTDRLEASGLAVREEKGETCCYAVADKTWATDPDGHPWELWVRTADADQRSGSSPACCA